MDADQGNQGSRPPDPPNSGAGPSLRPDPHVYRPVINFMLSRLDTLRPQTGTIPPHWALPSDLRVDEQLELLEYALDYITGAVRPRAVVVPAKQKRMLELFDAVLHPQSDAPAEQLQPDYPSGPQQQGTTITQGASPPRPCPHGIDQTAQTHNPSSAGVDAHPLDPTDQQALDELLYKDNPCLH